MVFLHSLQVYRKSVFLLTLAPVIVHDAIGGRENLPQLPLPRLRPRFRARVIEPRD